MERIYLWYFLIFIISLFFTKGKKNLLCCGIFGFVGDELPNINKLKILGIYNLIRGKDSCGFAYNGKVLWGIDSEKTFDKFIESDNVYMALENKEVKNRVFIGHTRQSSMGAATLENAHPHIINKHSVIVHNGTISNIWDLCNKYEIDHKGITNDSKALGMLIDKVGFSILNEYVGYAAILWHDVRKPNTLYVYHGASKEWNYEATPLSEERPLFGMLTNEGYYFSSLENSLQAIRDNVEQKPFKVEVNKVFKIEGSVISDEIFEVERTWNNAAVQKKTTTTNTATVHSSYPTSSSQMRAVAGVANTLIKKIGTDINRNLIDLAFETIPIRSFYLQEHHNGVNYLSWRNGRYYTYLEQKLAQGKYFITKQGLIIDNQDENLFVTTKPYYFYRGVFISTQNDYIKITSSVFDNTALGKSLYDSNTNFAKVISKYSKYPVTNMNSDYCNTEDKDRFAWFKNGKKYGGGVLPIFSDRNYIYKNGWLVDIKGMNKNDEPLLNVEKEILKSYNKRFVKTANVNNFEEGNNETFVKALAKYCDKVYKTDDELLDELPPTVSTAIRLYLMDVNLACTNSKYAIEEDSLVDACVDFLKICVHDEISIRDNMMETSKSLEEYLEAAYREEIQDDVDENENSKMVDAVMNQIPKIIIEDCGDGHERVTQKKSNGTVTIQIREKKN